MQGRLPPGLAERAAVPRPRYGIRSIPIVLKLARSEGSNVHIVPLDTLTLVGALPALVVWQTKPQGWRARSLKVNLRSQAATDLASPPSAHSDKAKGAA